MATEKGPLSRVSERLAAVIILSAIQFDGTAGADTDDVITTADAIGVDTILVDCSLIVSLLVAATSSNVTADALIEKTNAPIATIHCE